MEEEAHYMGFHHYTWIYSYQGSGLFLCITIEDYRLVTYYTSSTDVLWLQTLFDFCTDEFIYYYHFK